MTKLIEYDSDTQVVYLKMRKGEAVRTDEYKEEVFLDFDKHGRLLGIELLNLEDSKYLQEIARKFSVPVHDPCCHSERSEES